MLPTIPSGQLIPTMNTDGPTIFRQRESQIAKKPRDLGSTLVPAGNLVRPLQRVGVLALLSGPRVQVANSDGQRVGGVGGFGDCVEAQQSRDH